MAHQELRNGEIAIHGHEVKSYATSEELSCDAFLCQISLKVLLMCLGLAS